MGAPTKIVTVHMSSIFQPGIAELIDCRPHTTILLRGRFAFGFLCVATLTADGDGALGVHVVVSHL